MAHRSTPVNTVLNALAVFFAAELRAWRGDAPLGRVFWLYGVVVSSILIVLNATTIYQRELLAEQLLLPLLALYTGWILVSIWRCSLAVDSFWAMLARYLTIAWALNAALVLMFRQLDLIGAFIGLRGL